MHICLLAGSGQVFRLQSGAQLEKALRELNQGVYSQRQRGLVVLRGRRVSPQSVPLRGLHEHMGLERLRLQEWDVHRPSKQQELHPLSQRAVLHHECEQAMSHALLSGRRRGYSVQALRLIG